MPWQVGSKVITPQLIASLKWDDPKLLQSAKISSYPLQLRDGELLLLRDLESQPDLAEVSATPKQPPRGMGKGCRSKFSDASAASSSATSREKGVTIRTFHEEGGTGGNGAKSENTVRGSGECGTGACGMDSTE
ncbi:hypothetical protein AB1Y20_009271 [Prymnesium parvum]|uniref:Uncharacterized protein n=1 Tax=Prymnesium parvum TaxID=97485 RepID=A0AB34K136_PRYPA